MTLHPLFSMRAIQNLLVLDLLVEDRKIRGLIEVLTVQIPDFDDAEALLGTDGHADNFIRTGHRRCAECGCSEIALKDIQGVPTTDFQTVGTAANVDLVLPERARCSTHDAEETVRCLVGTEFAENLAKGFPAVDDLKKLVAFRGPGFVLWLMVIDGP